MQSSRERARRNANLESFATPSPPLTRELRLCCNFILLLFQQTFPQKKSFKSIALALTVIRGKLQFPNCIYILACPSPWQAPGYSESMGDTLPVPPKSRLCLGLRATLCSDLSVWISCFHFQRDCCPYFQVLRPLSFCPQSLPISFLSDSLNISRKSSWWEEWGGGVAKPLVNKGHPQSRGAGELSTQTRALEFSHF